jgi:hypothetical protein
MWPLLWTDIEPELGLDFKEGQNIHDLRLQARRSECIFAAIKPVSQTDRATDVTKPEIGRASRWA